MCSWFTLENVMTYRGAILGFLGGAGALVLAILEFRKPEADRKKWVAWLELVVAMAFFGQSVNDVWQVNVDAEEHKKSEQKFAVMSNNWVRAANELAQASNTVTRIDPLKHPIKSATAVVHFTLAEGVSISAPQNDNRYQSILYFSHRNEDASVVWLMLRSKDIEVYGAECFISLSLDEPGFLLSPTSRPAESVQKFLNSIDKCRLVAPGIRIQRGTNLNSTTDISAGDVTLMLNSSETKIFLTPAQKLPGYPMLIFTAFETGTNGLPIITPDISKF
jgi:hypothetical protein